MRLKISILYSPPCWTNKKFNNLNPNLSQLFKNVKNLQILYRYDRMSFVLPDRGPSQLL